MSAPQEKCPRCQDAGWVGGFLPAPCDECKPTELAQLRAELTAAIAERDAAREALDYLHRKVDGYDGTFEYAYELAGAIDGFWRTGVKP